MRTTFNAVNRHTQFVIGRKYAELGALQKKIATGKELLRPSDDPVAVANVLGLRSNNRGLTQFAKNMDDGLGWMEITDTVMVSMNNVLQSARELAIQGDSDTLSSKERSFLAEEVQQLTRQVISLSNSRFKGQYIFSGSFTDKPPMPLGQSQTNSAASYTQFKMHYFDGTAAAIGTAIPIMDPKGSASLADHRQSEDLIPGSFSLKTGPVGGVTTELVEGTDYQVDYVNGTVTPLTALAVAEMSFDFTPGSGNYGNGSTANNLQMAFDFAGKSTDVYGRDIDTTSRILREIESGVKVEVNISVSDFEVNNDTSPLSSLIALGDSLLSDDQVGIRSSMDAIDTAFSRILSMQTENGAKVNLFESTRERNETQKIETTRIQSLMEDADYSEVITQYSISQTVFDAALQSTAKIMQSSLANYI